MTDSPYKYLAQNLLSQYVLKKPVDGKHIGMFFSTDASDVVSEDLKEAYDAFTRFHKRKQNQANYSSQSFCKPKVRLSTGLEIDKQTSDDTDFIQDNLRDSFMFSGNNYKKLSKSQADLLNLDDSFISDLSSEDCDEMFGNRKYESPTFKELDESDKLDNLNLTSTEKQAAKAQRELIS